MSGNSFVTPEAAHRRFMDLYKENRVRALLEAMTPDYPAKTVLRCGVSRLAVARGSLDG